MKITIISGSNRKEAESFRISKWLQEKLKSQNDSSLEVDLVDLRRVDMSFIPDEFWAGQSSSAKAMAAEYKKLEESDGIVVVTPEWGGAASPVLKHFILMSGYSLAHKPVLAFGVSSTPVGGIRPIEDIKHTFKNARGVFLPEPIVINDVNNFLIGEERDQKREDYISGRADYALDLLLEYSRALKQVRESNKINHKDYPFGM